MKQANPREALSAFVAAHDNQRTAAEALDITPQYLSDLLRGQRPFSSRILESLGLKQIVVKS